ncbi:MAG: PepSY-like domain-containing protein [Rikenellaceae bacterium]|nr:PepSY-like domain-containing protein [Rikenellaceae bacterium]
MKRIIFFCAAVLALGACSNNDDLTYPGSEETRTTFDEMYPGAKGVKWEKRGIYKTAVFTYSGDRLTAWYNQDGVWCMTETRTDYEKAPVQVRSSFLLESGRSAGADLVDVLSRDGIEDIYVVVEGEGSARVEYYYSRDGILVKKLDEKSRIYEDYRNEIVPQIPNQVYSTIGHLYPAARIMEVDVIFPGILYIDVIDGAILKTLEFSLTGAWSMTSWEVTESYVKGSQPQVYEAFAELGYSDRAEITSIDCCENPSLRFYWFRVDNNGTEANVKISEEGNVLVVS